jgi:MFS family permease
MTTEPPAEARQKQPSKTIIALFIASAAFYWLGNYLYSPTLPVYVQSKVNDLASVGTILAMYGLWQALDRIPIGITADWIGRRRPFIIAGFALSGLGAYIMGTAGNATDLWIGRTVTGIAAGCWVPLVVAFSNMFPREEAVKASAWLTLTGSVSRFVATSSTGFLNALGGYSLAFYLAAGAAMAAILTFIPLPDPRTEPQKPTPTKFVKILTNKSVMISSLLGLALQYTVWATTFSFVPLLAKQLGATDYDLSAITSLNLGVMAVANFFSPGVVRRIGQLKTLYLSFLGLIIGVAISSVSPNMAVMYFAQLLVGLAHGLGYPVMMGMSIQDVGIAERGTAMGVYQAVYAIGMFAGPWIGGIISNSFGIRAMFGITAGMMVVVAIVGIRRLGTGSVPLGSLSK